MKTSPSILPIMRNTLDRICRENENNNFTYNTFPPSPLKLCHLRDNVEKTICIVAFPLLQWSLEPPTMSLSKHIAYLFLPSRCYMNGSESSAHAWRHKLDYGWLHSSRCKANSLFKGEAILWSPSHSFSSQLNKSDLQLHGTQSEKTP